MKIKKEIEGQIMMTHAQKEKNEAHTMLCYRRICRIGHTGHAQ